MPELPEVRNVVKSLKQNVLNKTIVSSKIILKKLIKNASAKEFENLIKNVEISNITNIGKFIIFKFSNNAVLVVHLRMEGKFKTIEDKNPHNHAIFNFHDGSKLIYNDTRQFGVFYLTDEKNYLKLRYISALAKEPQDTSPEELLKKFSTKNIAIKSSLLDQHLLVGLGNIYVNEVLWRTKIDPRTSTKNITLKQIRSILKYSHEIMEKATELGGSSIHSYKSLNSEKGEFQNLLKVHTRVNQPCSRCKTKIEKIWVNGRGTYFCPKCQH